MAKAKGRSAEPLCLPDTGCRWSPSCLSCSLAECVHDQALRKGRPARSFSAAELTELRLDPAGATARYGVSSRTVYRWIRAGAAEPRLRLE